MIIRVRSNLGTWKVADLDDDTATAKDLIDRLESQGKINDLKSRLEHPLSFDPAGVRPIDSKKSLADQNLGHGSMVYCRVSDEHIPATSNDRIGLTHQSTAPEIEASGAKVPRPPIAAVSHKRNVKGAMKKVNESNTVDLSNEIDSPTKNTICLLDSDSDESFMECMKASAKQRSTKSDTETPKTTRKRKASSEVGQKKNKPIPSTRLLSSNDVGADADGGLPSQFSLASYNVWFGPPDPVAGQVHPKERMRAIKDVLVQTRSNGCLLLFVGFQEITASLRTELYPLMISAGYQMYTQPMPPDFYGCALAVHESMPVLESSFFPYKESTQLRGILYARTKRILFATSHLESFVDREQYNGAKQREIQIQEMGAFMDRQFKDHKDLSLVVFTGDFNWDDERARSQGDNKPLLSLLPSRWVDAWKSMGRPASEGYTYDSKDNPMLGGSLRRRFDRCLLLPRDGSSIVVSDFCKVGQEAIPGLSWDKKNPYTGARKKVPVAPSDHFGIVVTLEATSHKLT